MFEDGVILVDRLNLIDSDGNVLAYSEEWITLITYDLDEE